MEVKKNGSQPSQKGPEEYFTGSVRIDPLFQAPEPARNSGALVTFEPGARSAWHWHPLGPHARRHPRLWLGAEARAGRRWRFGRAMSSGVRPTRGTGTALRQLRG